MSALDLNLLLPLLVGYVLARALFTLLLAGLTTGGAAC